MTLPSHPSFISFAPRSVMDWRINSHAWLDNTSPPSSPPHISRLYIYTHIYTYTHIAGSFQPYLGNLFADIIFYRCNPPSRVKTRRSLSNKRLMALRRQNYTQYFRVADKKISMKINGRSGIHTKEFAISMFF